MTEDDLEDFTDLWNASCENSRFKTKPSDAAISLAFDVLQGYSLKSVVTAILKFQRVQNAQLTPAIIESIITGCFWLSSDEAWGLAQRTFDPAMSVVVTKEIITAAVKVEQMYSGGERTAAKNTFIAIYERLMMTAISSGVKPEWKVWNLEQPTRQNSTENARRLAIIEAIDNGIIPMQTAVLLGYEPKQKTLSLQVLNDNAPDENTKKQIARLKEICHVANKNG